MMMKNKCKTCGANSDGEYCFRHKPRKQMSKMSSFLHQKFEKSEEVIRNISEIQQFFLHIWNKKPHYSEISDSYLGKEPLSIFFHHILPKEKHPEARLDEENIILLTLDEHTDVENDMYKYPEINRRRELLKQKYERTKESV
jgi:hypothetical protein